MSGPLYGDPKSFTITEQHVKLMRAWNVQQWDGVATVDAKRPYGNSGYIFRDIAKVVGVPLPEDGENDAAENWLAARLMELHEETTTALKILLHRAGEATPPGRYEWEDGRWQGVERQRGWDPS